MKFTTFLFALGTIASAAADTTSGSATASPTSSAPHTRITLIAPATARSILLSRLPLRRSTPEAASWPLYNRSPRPDKVRTVTLAQTHRQNSADADAREPSSQLSLRSSAKKGNWHVYKRKSRPQLVKMISLDEAQKQAEAGRSSGSGASEKRLKVRSIKTTVEEDTSSKAVRSVEQDKKSDRSAKENEGVWGELGRTPRGKEGVKMRLSGQERLMARRLTRQLARG